MEGSGGAGQSLSCFGIFLPRWDKHSICLGSRRWEQQVPAAWGCPWLLLPGEFLPCSWGSHGPWQEMWGWKQQGHLAMGWLRGLGESPAEPTPANSTRRCQMCTCGSCWPNRTSRQHSRGRCCHHSGLSMGTLPSSGRKEPDQGQNTPGLSSSSPWTSQDTL